MSISSTGLYGSATIVNSDLFTDVETLKETVTTLNTTYLQTTAEHRTDISQNRAGSARQELSPLQRLGGVVAAYEDQAMMLHMERSALFAWHMQHKAGLQENIRSMTATIKQLEERNMFLERRHKNCTGKLEDLLREQRKTEENDA